MTNLNLRLDHVGLCIRKLDLARDAFRKIGFNLSSRSMHAGSMVPGGPVIPWGSGNHCAMFKRGYFELLGLVDDSMPSTVKRMIGRYEGLHIVAMACESAQDAHKALAAAGTRAAPPAKLERDAAFGPKDEEVRRARFENVNLDEEQFPEARFIAIEHRTPEVLWQPHLMEHANGAQELNSVYFAVPDVDATVARFSPMLGAPDSRDGTVGFQLERGRFWIVPEAAMSSHSPVLQRGPINRVAAATIGVKSLSALAAYFDQQGVAYVAGASLDSPASIWVDPSEASHCALAFIQSAS